MFNGAIVLSLIAGWLMQRNSAIPRHMQIMLYPYILSSLRGTGHTIREHLHGHGITIAGSVSQARLGANVVAGAEAMSRFGKRRNKWSRLN